MLLLTIIAFILILGLLIFVHEFGHFISAKLCGVKVEEFGFGFPPKIFRIKKGETYYSVNWIPLGGFVKLLGEEEKSKDPRSFFMQSIWKRILIVIAGVIMNFVFAIFILTIGFSVGMTPIVSDPASLGGKQQTEIIIAGTTKDSPAAAAGIISGDIVTGYNSVEDFQAFTKNHKNEEITLNIKREHKPISINVKVSDNIDAPLGVALAQATIVKLPPLQAFKAAFVETGRTCTAIFKFLYDFFHDLFTGKKVSDQVAGPVGIFTITKQAVKLGIGYVLQFMALLSINLGIMNILPFPALDGGKAIFLIAEAIRGKKVVKVEVENIIHWIGFIILIALVILITYNDIVRLIKG
jgi:regulator of sigma E protease